MSMTTLPFTTGPCTMPDVGDLTYNGCIFSPLFATNVNANFVKDSANRTVRFVEYSISADGYVTLPTGATSINGTMATLRRLLSAQGGALTYRGRGCDIIVNAVTLPGTTSSRDVAWGPVPEILEFQPLGGGLSAKIKWQCKTRIPEVAIPAGGALGGLAAIPLIQFNYDTVVSYNDDWFSTLTIRGTIEIPLTRTPSIATRTLTQTVDNVRSVIDGRIMPGIDLSRYKVARREFNVSRDKRTMEFSIGAEEKPYMDISMDCTIARGSYSVRPAKSGMGLVTWLCTLRATYTVRPDRPRRTAWHAFLTMLRVRMLWSALGYTPGIREEGTPDRGTIAAALLDLSKPITNASYATLLKAQKDSPAFRLARKSWLIDLSFDEGLYLDSKTVSFSATWRLVTSVSHIILASGLWRKVPERNILGLNLWATSMRDVAGSQSWLANRLDPKLDIIVDLGGG
jgi:hypothetical protein